MGFKAPPSGINCEVYDMKGGEMEAQKPTYDDLAAGGDDGLWLWRGKPPNPTQLPTPTGSRKLQRSFLSVAALLVLGSSVAHRPVKFGRRFWAKAHTASWWSLV